MTNLKKHLPLIVLGLAGLVIFVILAGNTFPYKAANLEIDKTEAIAIAREFLTQKGVKTQDYKIHASVGNNDYPYFYLQKRFGLEKFQYLVRDGANQGMSYFWNVLWFQAGPKGSEFHSYTVTVSNKGKIIGLLHDIPITTDFPTGRQAHLPQDQALEAARAFLTKQGIDLAGYEKDNFATRRYEKRSDHAFNWKKAMEQEAGKVSVRVVVRGDEVDRFTVTFGVPESDTTATNRMRNRMMAFNTVSFIFIFILCIIIQSMFLKKYHEGEVNIKSGVIVFFLIWLTLAVDAALNFRVNGSIASIGGMSFDAVSGVLFFLYVLVVYPFFSIMGFGAWSVSESLGREKFSRKFTAMDSLFRRKFSTVNAAGSILNGYLAGFLGLGFITLLIFASVHLAGGRIKLGGYDQLASFFPLAMMLLLAASSSLISELTFRLFANLMFYKYLKSKWGSIFASSVLWTLFAYSMWSFRIELHPVGYHLAVIYLCGVFLGYIFWRFDILTAIFAHFTIVGVSHALPLLTSPSRGIFYQGLGGLVLVFFPLLFVIRGFIKKEEFQFEADLVPAHIRRITQRARMSKELEIARQVQMKLLPAEPPHIEGFEMEGICIPANEVGGDYYDFIPMDESRLAVLIGDVSGKGVPAAIYMTLTKGIIHSQAEHELTFSPEQVLTRVNRSLYQMMDHKSFVTLFFGILDVKKRILSYSRAGHNPLLYFRRTDNKVIALKPSGIALGIEKGLLFNESITEETLKLEKDDVIVFYTDGFSEAMNSELHEYGEHRLMDTVQKHKKEPVKQIIERVVADVDAFTKGYPQHDDMTMVIVKVF